MSVCRRRQKTRYPTIDLTFEFPQTILEVEFFDVGVGGADITYSTTNGQTKTAVANGEEGEAAIVDLSRLTDPAPVNIKQIRLLSGVIPSLSAVFGKQ